MPARERDLFDRIASFTALQAAALRAVRGKRAKPGASAFLANLEKEVLRLERELRNDRYGPGRYKTIEIRDPKHRIVSAAPFRDRVVHQAFCAVCEPVFERGFIHDSYANRKGKGTHRAITRYEAFRGRFRYVLRCDVYRYFPAIDHEILKADIRRRIACDRTLALADRIIDGSNPQEAVNEYFNGDNLFTPFERRRGLPISNLTSQFFSNLYLDGLDHFCKEVLRVKGYVRYVDDFALFHDDTRAPRGMEDPGLGIPGRPPAAAPSEEDLVRSHERACGFPRYRPPAERTPAAAGRECPAFPQPASKPPRALAPWHGGPQGSRAADRSVDRPRGTCTHLATSPGDLPGRVVRFAPEAWPPP